MLTACTLCSSHVLQHEVSHAETFACQLCVVIKAPQNEDLVLSLLIGQDEQEKKDTQQINMNLSLRTLLPDGLVNTENAFIMVSLN